MVRVVVLPDSDGFPVTLRLDRFKGLGAGAVARVAAMDEEGRELRRLEVDGDGRNVTFRTRRGEFGVLVELEGRP